MNPCPIDRSYAFARAQSIADGHSVLCACASMSAACPIALGLTPEPTPIRVALAAINESLDRTRAQAGRGT